MQTGQAQITGDIVVQTLSQGKDLNSLSSLPCVQTEMESYHTEGPSAVISPSQEAVANLWKT